MLRLKHTVQLVALPFTFVVMGLALLGTVFLCALAPLLYPILSGKRWKWNS